MSHRPMRLPASLGEFVLILSAFIGIMVMVAFAASTVFWGVKTILNVDYMTVLTHLIVGWIGATIGIMLGERTEDNT